jgi:hypothetical protein
MQCTEFDALLWEALEGSLGGAELERFQAHRAECASCGPMFAEAQAGRTLLRALDEVEPAANLLHNILAATVGRVEEAPAERPAESWWERLRARLQPVAGPVLQPKFVMSFAMAFFSITLLLNVAGINLGELKHVDLRPSALVRGYYETQGRLVKYYENIRFVYEIESRVQQLKRATTPEERTPAPEQKDRKEKGGEPDRKYQNYSRDQEGVTVARYFERMLDLHIGSARRLS